MARQDYAIVDAIELGFNDKESLSVYYEGVPYIGHRRYVTETYTAGVYNAYTDEVMWNDDDLCVISPLCFYNNKFYATVITDTSPYDLKLLEIDPSDWTTSVLATQSSINSISRTSLETNCVIDHDNDMLYYSYQTGANAENYVIRSYNLSTSTDASVGTYTNGSWENIAFTGMWSDNTYIYFIVRQYYSGTYKWRAKKMLIADGTVTDISITYDDDGPCTIGETGMFANSHPAGSGDFNKIINLSDGKEWDLSSEITDREVMIVYPEGVDSYPIKTLILFIDSSRYLKAISLNSDESITVDNTDTLTDSPDPYGNILSVDATHPGRGGGIQPVIMTGGYSQGYTGTFVFRRSDIA